MAHVWSAIIHPYVDRTPSIDRFVERLPTERRILPQQHRGTRPLFCCDSVFFCCCFPFFSVEQWVPPSPCRLFLLRVKYRREIRRLILLVTITSELKLCAWYCYFGVKLLCVGMYVGIGREQRNSEGWKQPAHETSLFDVMILHFQKVVNQKRSREISQ